MWFNPTVKTSYALDATLFLIRLLGLSVSDDEIGKGDTYITTKAP